jgi:hypothetical protein
LDREGWLTTLARDPSPPLFPIIVNRLHALLRATGTISPSDWGLCAQLAAGLSLVVAAPLAYAFFHCFVPTWAAAVGSLFFCAVTVVARLGGDGLSDGTQLVCLLAGLACTGRYLAGRADQSGDRPAWLVLAGASIGLGLLCRSEAAIVLLAVATTLVVETWLTRSPERISLVRAEAALGLGVSLAIVPYLILSGAYTPAAAVERLVGRRGPDDMAPFNASATEAARVATISSKPAWRLPDGRPMVFGRKDFSSSTRFNGLARAAFELLREMAQSLHYVLGLLALYGFWTMRSVLQRPIGRLLVILYVLYLGAALYVSWQSGYLSGRHLLPLVTIALAWAGVGVWQLASKLPWPERSGAGSRGSRSLIANGWVALLVVGCLCSTLAPLHASRVGHRQASDWLASSQARRGTVLDSVGLTALYTGRTTYRYHAAAAAFSDPNLAYVVIEQSELAAHSQRGATMREMLAQWASPAASFAPDDAKSKDRTVLVYDWQGERFAQYLGESHAP